MIQPHWQFRKMSKGEMNIDPIEGEFFSTEALGSLSDALIRETIQNSLDAAIPGEKVKLVFTFPSPAQYLPPYRSEPYLRGLRNHLGARGCGLLSRVTMDEPMDFLIIEDFGTRGLEGDIREDEEGEIGGKKNDFFYFWRNIGRALEGTTARGRWGLGKTVFQASSRINSFFGLTIRRQPPAKLLMGQSVLKIHWCDGSKYGPYGYFGLFEGDFALPCEDPKFIETFSNDFCLCRKEEPGLSIVVPFPEKELTPGEVLRAVVNQYFFPILSGDLAVTVVEGNREQELSRLSILRFVENSNLPDRDSIRRRLEFAKWAIELPEESCASLKEPPVDQGPKWDENLFEPEQLTRLRRSLDEGERIALRVPLWVKKEAGELQRSFFKVYLERDHYLEPGEDFFIRDGITITGVSSLRQGGMRVIVTVSDRPLSRLLGDSENPAHTEWQERSPKFRGRYVRGPSCLRFVKNSPKEIVKILSKPAEGRDADLLRELFYLELPRSQAAPGSRMRPTKYTGSDGPEGGVGPQGVSADRFLFLQRTEQGFRLSALPHADILPKEIEVEMAYDVRQGNPFHRYSPLDFELNKPPIKIKGRGVKVSISKPNRLHVVIEERGFQLLVTGFDPNRDLKIRTTTSLDLDGML
ncbi:MAG: hypothetical protein N3G78_04075 [Desulfobacterota bacterium]|nr:hypothetical protein [Thermodesulfobacteriota bacterium]